MKTKKNDKKTFMDRYWRPIFIFVFGFSSGTFFWSIGLSGLVYWIACVISTTIFVLMLSKVKMEKFSLT